MPDLFAYLEGFGTGESFTKSVIIVTDLPTGATVTATKGPIRKTTTEKNAEWWFKGLDLGEWTLDAALDGQTATTKFNIERFGVYYVPMSFFKATIHTKYPVGSTCTCSKGDKTFTAPDTSGTWDCVVDSAGDWTVTITKDGQEPVSETVTITSDGETKTIELSYTPYIFKEGEGLAVGAKHIESGDLLATVSIDNISLSKPKDSSAGTFGVDKGYDVTNYNQLVVELGGDIIDMKIGLSKTIVSDTSADFPAYKQYGSAEDTPRGEIKIDISNVRGTAYFGVVTYAYVKNNFKIYNIYFKS